MSYLEDTIKGIFALIVGVWVFIIIGQQFHWFDWVGPTFRVIWLIIKILLGVALVAGIIWFIYYIKNKPKIEKEKQEKISLGKKRRNELPAIEGYSDYDLGKISKEEFQELKLKVEKEIKEKEKKKKELELEVGIVLTKVKKCKSDELIDLDEEQKEYQINKWKKEIREMIEAGNNQQVVIDYMCGDKEVKIIKPKSNERYIGNKLETIKSAIEDYNTDKLVRDERDLENFIYEYLRNKFPEYDFKPQVRVSKGRVDIVVDDEIAIELKIADNKGNLNSLFGQINWYTQEYDKLLIVMLDLNRVPDLQDFIDDFEEKGAEVVILTEENVRFRRLNKKHYHRY